MSLSELSIRRPVFAWMLMAALIIFGALSFHRLGVSQLPDVDFPVVGIQLSLPGAAPEVMEGQVIDTIEDAVMQIGGIRSVSSSANQSSGNVSVEFELDRNIDEAVQEVQNRISQVRNLLPINLNPPSVRKFNPEDQPIIWVAVQTDGKVAPIDLMIFARNYLFNQFATIEGVGDINMGGYADPALRVWLEKSRLRKWELTADDIVNAIVNEHVETPAGRIENDLREYNVRLMGEAATPEEFGKILINNRAGAGANFRPQQLKDVATIVEGTVDVRRVSRFNGFPAVGLGILKQHGSNAVEVAQRVRARLKEIEPSIPGQFKVSIRNDSTRFIKQSVDQLTFTLVLSALLTSLVCFLFLGSLASTLNVLLAIPTSIIGTFMAIYFFGFTLNTFTLLGLSLAIGIVVDDAIMMLENIVRHQQLGEKRKLAAIKGSREITFAALAATIAVVAIFIPVVFMKGVIGRYFFQYGITVSAAVLLSLLEALTLTPMRCSQYLTVTHHSAGFAAFVDRLFARLANAYRRVLEVLLNHRWKTIFVTFGLFGASLFVAKSLPSEMIPAQDQSLILLRLKAPVGSALEYTDEKVRRAEDYVRGFKEVEGVFSMTGGFGGDSVNQANLLVSLVDKDKRKRSQAEIVEEMRPELVKRLNDGKAPEKGKGKGKGKHGDGIQVVAQDMSLRGFSKGRGFPIEFIVQGPDWAKLTQVTNEFMEALGKTGVATDINTDIQPRMREVNIIPDREKLARHAVQLKAVTSAVNALVGGALLKGQTEYAKAGHRYQIELRLVAGERDRAEQLKEIFVRNNRGQLVALSELVTLVEKPSLQTITRLNRARSITVHANAATGHSQQEGLATVQNLAKSTLPPGYFVKMTGSAQSFKESFDTLILALLLGIVVSYMVLGSQFNSFIHPVTVLLALPFSLSGAFVALKLFHQSLNVYSLIGFILLMGIVKKNSILLVDFTNQCRDEGMPIRAALVHACPVRLRPILMTSIAIVAGALPEALSLGPGAESIIPMAVTIIGGVIASTILTLFVVPCAYSLLTRLESPDPLALEELAGKKAGLTPLTS